MRTKQYLAAIRVSGDVLLLETLVDSMTVAWDPDRYEDT